MIYDSNKGCYADVESKKTTLIEIVQQLGEYINDEDPILRGKAVSFLTSVIKALSPRFLSRQQIQVLTTFFCDRIEDGGAVAGLETLQALDRFTKEMAVETAQAYVPPCPCACIGSRDLSCAIRGLTWLLS